MHVHWVPLIVSSLMISAIPGPNQILCFQNSVKLGSRHAAVALIGRFSAFAALNLLGATGVSSALYAYPRLRQFLTAAGVAYLVWLSLSCIREARRRNQPVNETARPRGAARDEFMTAITNPKAYLLFAAFTPQFAADHQVSTMVLTGMSYISVEAITAGAYIEAGRRLTKQLAGRGGAQRLQIACALGYLAAAFFLTFTL